MGGGWDALDGALRQQGLAAGTKAPLGPLRAEYAGGLSGLEWGILVFGGAAMALLGLVVIGYGVVVGDGLDLYAFGPALLVFGTGFAQRPVARSRRWWVGAFELGVVGVHDRRAPVTYRWADLALATYLRTERYYNFQHTETRHRLRIWPASGKTLEFRQNDSVVSPPAVRLGDFAAVIVSQLAAQEAAQIVAGVSEGRRERCGGPIDAVLTPEGLTWGGRTYPWRVVGGLRGYTANTWNQGKVDLLSPNGGPPLGSFYLGAGMSSDTVGACMAVDMLAHGAR